jgi:serine/threonine-protein kinase
VTKEPYAPAGRPGSQTLPNGAVLNHIYEVRRFIDRGGMGEVYEGININNPEERVAIKVILPALAADPAVEAMFRKEARTLTRLSHRAIAQFRLLAREPELQLLYIVTEYIDGPPLSRLLSTLKPSTADLVRFLRRMADGLNAAHQLGAVHRDMSPDNILLAGGQLDQAKIIDFGIAKELDTGQTIVGTGFAGKLAFVAPEQLGDFGQQIGPWTDIYSLGLVLLAVARGEALHMGATPVEAIDKRRAGVDVSGAPETLRPIVAKMLAADPKQRYRSMEELLAALEAVFGPPTTLITPGPPVRRFGAGKALLAGAALAAAAAAGVAALMLLKPTPPSGEALVATARRLAGEELEKLDCAWLSLASVEPHGSGVAIGLEGAAGSTRTAEIAVADRLKAAKIELVRLDQFQVAPLPTPACRPVNAFRAMRAPQAARHLAASQDKYEIQMQPGGGREARPALQLAIGDPGLDFALLAIDGDGRMEPISGGRAELERRAREGSPMVAALPGDGFSLRLRAPATQSWAGVMLLTGKGPFPMDLLTAPPGARGGDWERRIKAAGASGKWSAELVSYRITDSQADAPAAPVLRAQPESAPQAAEPTRRRTRREPPAPAPSGPTGPNGAHKDLEGLF